MIRLALPKGRNIVAARAALAAAGVDLGDLDDGSRRLVHRLPDAGLEVLLLKDWDLPLYVERGVADLGIVGSDVLEEVDGDLLVPLRLVEGGCRLSLIGPPGSLPQAGEQKRVGTKYPRTTAAWLAERAWGAELLPLSGSVELAPLLDLADVIVDIVQTGRTLTAHGLEELETVREVAPSLVVNRGAWQRLRRPLNDLFSRLEAAEVAG